jgi:hypothetical protein
MQDRTILPFARLCLLPFALCRLLCVWAAVFRVVYVLLVAGALFVVRGALDL